MNNLEYIVPSQMPFEFITLEDSEKIRKKYDYFIADYIKKTQEIKFYMYISNAFQQIFTFNADLFSGNKEFVNNFMASKLVALYNEISSRY